LVEAIENIVRRARDVRSLTRIDLHQDRILRVAFANERRDGRIAGETAIPEIFPIDFDGLEHGWQASGRHQDIRGNLGVAENTSASGPHAGGRNEQLYW